MHAKGAKEMHAKGDKKMHAKGGKEMRAKGAKDMQLVEERHTHSNFASFACTSLASFA